MACLDIIVRHAWIGTCAQREPKSAKLCLTGDLSHLTIDT
jgi:hypothetical protein